jgi:23S rRNA pseudouridine955/2504/2580 synthase
MSRRRIDDDLAGQRLDRYLRKLLANVPLSRIYKLCRTGAVRLNGRRARPETKLESGDVVDLGAVEMPAPAPKTAPAEDLRALPALPVLYEDEVLLVIDKPAGLAVHPGSRHERDTVLAALRRRTGAALAPDAFAPAPVHRLDRDTSGVLLVAKTRRAAVALSATIAAGRVGKTYLALAHGRFAEARGTLASPIVDRETQKPRRAVTHFEVLATGAATTLLSVRLDTGRTHQIRKHLAAAGHPLVGDRRYGDARRDHRLTHPDSPPRLCLHAASVTLAHPQDGETRTFAAPLPAELRGLLARLGLRVPAPLPPVAGG